jgi:hypothetical protein
MIDVHTLQRVADELIEEAHGAGTVLRISGSLAVRHHCRDRQDVLDALEREPPGDVDLFSYWKECDAIEAMFKKRGWEADPTIVQSREWGVKRLIYYEAGTETKVEVFFDTLKMSHEIDVRHCLERDFPTVPLETLLLSKLQIHELTAKDVKDTIALLAVHPLDEGRAGGTETIDLAEVRDVLCNDWGLWYTAGMNLRATRERLDAHARLDPGVRQLVAERLETIERTIEEHPKSMRWKLRAKIGTRTRWYEEVGDVDR